MKLPQEFRFFFVLGLLMGLVAVVENWVTAWFGDQTLSPLLSIVSIAILATRFSPGFVLTSIVPFAFLSYLLIQDSSRFPLIRALTVCFGGLIAAWASWQKTRLDRQIREFEAVIMHLPQPWILCDFNSKIIRASLGFAALVGKTQEQLTGAPHFSLLAPAETDSDKKEPGKVPARSERLQLHPFLGSNLAKNFQATYVPVVIQDDHCLLIILEEI